MCHFHGADTTADVSALFQQQICRNNADSRQTSADTKKLKKLWIFGSQGNLVSSNLLAILTDQSNISKVIIARVTSAKTKALTAEFQYFQH